MCAGSPQCRLESRALSFAGFAVSSRKEIKCFVRAEHFISSLDNTAHFIRAWYAQKTPVLWKGRGLKRTRVTTFVRKQLTLLTSVSVRQHSGAINVRYYVTAYYWKIPERSLLQIRCEARGCIRSKILVRLSSAGSFLFRPLTCTSSRHSLFSASVAVIIGINGIICQGFSDQQKGRQALLLYYYMR